MVANSRVQTGKEDEVNTHLNAELGDSLSGIGISDLGRAATAPVLVLG